MSGPAVIISSVLHPPVFDPSSQDPDVLDDEFPVPSLAATTDYPHTSTADDVDADIAALVCACGFLPVYVTLMDCIPLRC